MYIFKAGVVGAGWMGGGIAQVITYSGLPVVLKDVDQKMLDKGMDALRSIYQRRVDGQDEHRRDAREGGPGHCHALV